MIDWEVGKEYKLRNGWRARLLSADASDPNYPLVIEYWNEKRSEWNIAERTINGTSRIGGEPLHEDRDLIPP